MLALDLSFSAPNVTPGWCRDRINEGVEMLIVDLWTGLWEIPKAQQALQIWRDSGGRATGGYFVVHEYNNPVEYHYDRARRVAGTEWDKFTLCAVDAEIDPVSPEGLRRAHDLTVESGVQFVPIYTGWWFWSKHMGNTDACADLPWWPAQYDNKPTLDNLILYGGWQKALGKQYTNTTNLDGIEVDYNVFDDIILGGDMNQAQINELNAIADMLDNPNDPQAAFDSAFADVAEVWGRFSQYGFNDSLSKTLRDNFRGMAERLRKIPDLQ